MGELPQEIMNEIKSLIYTRTWNDETESDKEELMTGAEIAQSHYEQIIEAKDTTIKELEAELERVKGLMKELHAQTWQMSGKQKDRGWAQYKGQHNINP